MNKLKMKYVPVLKWRQGEYQTLHRLSDSIKDSITPLVNIPPIEWDFEEKRMKKIKIMFDPNGILNPGKIFL